MHVLKLIIVILFVVSCTHAPKAKRHTSSLPQLSGKISILKGDDTGKLESVKNEGPEECGITIIAKDSPPGSGTNCFDYKVQSTMWTDEVTLRTSFNTKTGQCNSYAISDSLKDPTDSKIFFIKFNLEFDEGGTPKKFIQSISYGFSGIAKICSFEN